MKKSFLLATGLLTLIASLVGIFFIQAPRSIPVVLHCPDGKIGTLSWSSQAASSLNLLKEHKLNPLGLAKEQSIYLRGQLHFGFHRGDITPLGHPHIFLSSSQTNNATNMLEVTFNVQQKVLLCDSRPASLELFFPLDPLSAYWLEPENEWIEQSFNGKTKRAPACAFSQVIDFTPVHYWYVWSPLEKGHYKGTPFDCEKKWRNHPGVVKTMARLELDEGSPTDLTFNFFENESTWKISHVWGFIGESDHLAKMPILRQELTKLRPLALAGVRPIYSSSWQIEPSIGALFTMIRYLNSSFKWANVQITEHKGHFIISLQGKGIASKKAIELQLFYGPSIPRHGSEVHQEMKKFWLNALETSPLIFYTGHAEVGNALPLEVPAKHIPQHQLLGVFACFSTSYWTQEDFKVSTARPNTIRDLVSMGFEGYAIYGGADLLIMLDNWISSKNNAWQNYLKRHHPLNPVAWSRKIIGPLDYSSSSTSNSPQSSSPSSHSLVRL